MPMYAYRCDAGHEFEQHGRMDGSDRPTRCPVRTDPESVNCRCDASVQKVLAAPARVFPGADSWRTR